MDQRPILVTSSAVVQQFIRLVLLDGLWVIEMSVGRVDGRGELMQSRRQATEAGANGGQVLTLEPITPSVSPIGFGIAPESGEFDEISLKPIFAIVESAGVEC